MSPRRTVEERLGNVSGQTVRRLRLPPADTSPAAARAAVAAVLDETGLDPLRPEALLLTSELVTNGVIHARTEIEVEIIADAEGVRVTVTDFAVPDPSLVVAEVTIGGAGPDDPDGRPPAGRLNRLDDAQPAEGGRGLLLVSRFASRWGTTHEPGGRQVWFQLDRSPETEPQRPTVERAAIPTVEEAIGTVLGEATESVGQPTSAPHALTDLVTRLGRALGAATATVSVDRADGRGAQTVARYASGESFASDGRAVRVPLPLSRPWIGEFTATGARGRFAESLAGLTVGQLGLLVENQRLHEAHSEGRGWLLFLAHAGELLAQSMNVDLTVALIPRLVVPRLGMWCAVHLTNEYGELGLAALTHADETAVPTLSKELDTHLDALDAVLTSDGFVPLEASQGGMSYSLTVREETLGTLTAGRPPGRHHTPEELAIIEDLARRAAVAIDNARVHDTRSRIAATLQRSLLPPDLPQIDGLEVAAQYVPAGDGLDVGGDFYDLVPLPGQGWLLVVGDVSGKGAGAAAVTGLVREVLHTLAADYRQPAETLARLNATLVERGGGYFCTLALAFLRVADPTAADLVAADLVAGGLGRGGLTETGLTTADLATPVVFDLALHLAGHDQPVLLRANGATSMVGACGTALGLLNDITVPRTTIRLRRGDSLVFYTDGVTERRKGGRLFGHKRLRSEISSLVGSPASVLASRLRRSVLAFSSQPPKDDIAIVALRAV
jgi:serine phosphatase RsbU (regulator of sigma subunit)/anti-sigma regulatory factor (Ser/Thr protein kinase)